jgi:predicted DCC family thiol-disulfide oxidoreductase YuxK
VSESFAKGAYRGTIFYDVSCGFCSRWVPFWSNTLAARGFQIAPLQSELAKREFMLPEDELISDLRLLTADGTKLEGANVYRRVLRHIWWAWPIYLLAILPGPNLLFDGAYRTFARNRFRVSRACHMPAQSHSAHGTPRT